MTTCSCCNDDFCVDCKAVEECRYCGYDYCEGCGSFAKCGGSAGARQCNVKFCDSCTDERVEETKCNGCGVFFAKTVTTFTGAMLAKRRIVETAVRATARQNSATSVHNHTGEIHYVASIQVELTKMSVCCIQRLISHDLRDFGYICYCRVARQKNNDVLRCLPFFFISQLMCSVPDLSLVSIEKGKLYTLVYFSPAMQEDIAVPMPFFTSLTPIP